MKDASTKTTICFILGIALLITACTVEPKRTTTDIPILYDVTELQQAKPVAAEIIPLYDLDADIWNAATFSFKEVTDVSYTKRTAFTLPEGGNRLRASSYTRKREVKQFTDSITAFLDSLTVDTVGRPHSSIFVPLAEELNRLAESTAERRILIVYSDLKENAMGLSFYDKQTLAQLQQNPEKIKEKLRQKAPLAELKGIAVYIVYEPRNTADDDLFQKISKIYTEILKDKGATVHVVGNLSGIPNH
jgi:hypothetical protein